MFCESRCESNMSFYFVRIVEPAERISKLQQKVKKVKIFVISKILFSVHTFERNV